MPPDAEVARSHLAQRPVEIGEHRIEKPLPQLRGGRLLGLEAMQEQKGVQANQLETAIDRIGHPDIGEKSGLARLVDDAAIGQLGGFLQRVASGQ